MNIQAAIEASSYDTAAAETLISHHEIIVGADGHDGLYAVEVVDSSGNRRATRHGVSLDDVAHDYPGLNWYPVREDGEWGDEVEAKLQAGQ